MTNDTGQTVISTTMNANTGQTMTTVANDTIETMTQALPEGGLEVTMRVPTAFGPIEFVMSAERDSDGDWRVAIPSSATLSDEPVRLDNGCEALNGLVYLSAPEVPSTA